MQQLTDIQDAGARSTEAAPIVPLAAPGIVPLRFGPPKVVMREHANNAVRWKAGERLNTCSKMRASASPTVMPSSPTTTR